LPYLT